MTLTRVGTGEAEKSQLMANERITRQGYFGKLPDSQKSTGSSDHRV